MCYNLIRVLLRRGLKVLASIAGGRGKTMGVRDFNLRNSIVRKNGEDSFEPVLNVHTPLSSTLTPNFYVPLYKSLAKRKFFLGKKKKKWGWGRCPQLVLPSYPYVWGHKWLAGHVMPTTALGLHISDFCACYFPRPSQLAFLVNLLIFSEDANIDLMIIQYFCNILLLTFNWSLIVS